MAEYDKILIWIILPAHFVDFTMIVCQSMKASL